MTITGHLALIYDILFVTNTKNVFTYLFYLHCSSVIKRTKRKNDFKSEEHSTLETTLVFKISSDISEGFQKSTWRLDFQASFCFTCSTIQGPWIKCWSVIHTNRVLWKAQGWSFHKIEIKSVRNLFCSTSIPSRSVGFYYL